MRHAGLPARVCLAGVREQLAGVLREAWTVSRGGMHSAFARAVVVILDDLDEK